MGLVDNLVEGLSNAAGATGAVDAFEKKKADRRATQHEELEANTKSILDDVKTLRERRAALPAGDPGIADIDKALTQHQQAFHDLYHPIKNPGALSKLGGFLQKHLTGKDPAPAPQSNEVTPERMAGLESSAAGTQANPYELKKRALMATGVAEDEATRLATGQKDPKQEAENWQTSDVTLSDGSVQTLQHNTKSGEWTDLNGQKVPAERLSGATVKPKAGAALRVGSFGEFLQQAYGANPTAEQIEDGRKRWAQAASGTTVGEHVIQVPQIDGTIKAFTVQTTSHKEFGAPSVPKTPGEAKSKAAPRAHAGIVGGGETVGGKLTSAQTDAQKKYYDAIKLSSQADQVAKNPNDAVNQKRLAVALERAAAGRFTTQALDYIIKAGWGNTLEQWANNPSTGALPADVMRQLIQGAHQNLTASKVALDEAMKPVAGSAPTQSTGKAVSLAAAKKLPAMQGKTDDQIKAAIKASGHEVLP